MTAAIRGHIVDPVRQEIYDGVVHVKDGVITFAQFTKGCSGNTQGVCVLIKGMKVQDAIDKLDGILCGRRGTSCPDQLATALKLL